MAANKYTFSQAGVKRLKTAVEAQERKRHDPGLVEPGTQPYLRQVLKAQTPSGGIAAGASATCTEGAWGGSSYTAGTNTMTVWNPSSTGAVSGSIWVTIAWVSGRWECILEPC